VSTSRICKKFKTSSITLHTFITLHTLRQQSFLKYFGMNADLTSKRVLTLVHFITTLTNQATDAKAPVLTIPTC